MTNRTQLFENSPIHKAVWNLALPTLISMLVTVLYNLADTYFIGKTGDTKMVAAITLAFPLFMLCSAVGNLFGIGGSSTISRNMGEGRLQRVKNVSAFAIWGSILSGIIFGACILIFMNNVIQLLGSDTQTSQYVKDYLSIIAIGAPFIILSLTFTNIVRSEGASRQAMTGSMIGTISNIILDPIMILYFDFNVQGAAYATVIGNMAACIYYFIYMKHKTEVLSGRLKHFKISEGVLKDVFKIGVASFFNHIIMTIANIIYNNFLLVYGTAAVAAAGIAAKGSLIMTMVLVGIAVGAQPLIGYNYGANNYNRLNNTIKYILKTGIILGTLIAITIALTAKYFVRSFINDPLVIEYGTKMLRVLSITGPVLMFNFVAMITLQSMGKTAASLLMSISRRGLLSIPAFIITSKYFGLSGLIWAQPVADILASLLGAILLFYAVKKIKITMQTISK